VLISGTLRPWRPIVASLLVATGFALAAMTFGPVGF